MKKVLTLFKSRGLALSALAGIALCLGAHSVKAQSLISKTNKETLLEKGQTRSLTLQDRSRVSYDAYILGPGDALQIEILDLLKDLTRESSRTIVMVLHDLNLAVRYAENLIAMRDGEIRISGKPTDVVTSQMIHDVFSIQAQIITDPVSGSPLCIPLPNDMKHD